MSFAHTHLFITLFCLLYSCFYVHVNICLKLIIHQQYFVYSLSCSLLQITTQGIKTSLNLTVWDPNKDP